MTPETQIVRVERAVYGGAGLARTAMGKVLFVPFTLPGEEVEIESPEADEEVRLLRVMQPSPARVAPRCRHFGRCGGCQYQHADYAAQLEMKRGILLETMQRAGVAALPAIEVHAGEAWEYRNRVRFRIGSSNGDLRVGYSVRESNEFLPIAECPIAAPLLWRAALAVLQVAESSPEARSWLQAAAEMEFFVSDDLTQVQMILWHAMATPAKKGGFANLCKAVQQRVPELTGAGVVKAAGHGRSLVETEIWGAAGLSYHVGLENYWIGRGRFFQVNRFLIDRMVSLVCDGRRGAMAWDLYAGIGLFSRVLARSFASVTAVEANTAAAGDLQVSLAKLGAEHRAVASATLNFLREAAVQRERPELVVLDPPRAGAGREVCALLLRVAARTMVYVSCDPTTLARDLVVLQRGYRIAAMHLIDMFPQTSHLETVVVLEAK